MTAWGFKEALERGEKSGVQSWRKKGCAPLVYEKIVKKMTVWD